MQRFCTLYEIPYLPEMAIETLVESGQAVWWIHNGLEIVEFRNERPWWQRWLHVAVVKEVKARLTDGAEVYPSVDLIVLQCGSVYVVIMWERHPDTMALGSIPTPELRKARQKIRRCTRSIVAFRVDIRETDQLSNRLQFPQCRNQ